jgi:hypothetical protein
LGVPLAEGVTLLLEAARPPDEHDLEAVRAAAAPLLRLLEARGVVPGIGERGGEARRTPAKGEHE